MRAEALLLGGLLCGLASWTGCAQSRCAGEECAEHGAGSRAVHPISSQHYRIALRVRAVEGRELRSERYRVRAVAGTVQLEAKP